jgi:hypothetical protein
VKKEFLPKKSSQNIATRKILPKHPPKKILPKNSSFVNSVFEMKATNRFSQLSKTYCYFK